jgi:hypothetical protein
VGSRGGDHRRHSAKHGCEYHAAKSTHEDSQNTSVNRGSPYQFCAAQARERSPRLSCVNLVELLKPVAGSGQLVRVEGTSGGDTSSRG